MESSLAGKPERVGPVDVDDIRRDLLSEFSALTAQGSGPGESENLQVFLRVRPFTSAESDGGESQDCVTVEGLDTVVLKAPRAQPAHRFTFTQVFGPDASQRTVFEGSVRGLVQDVLEGGNCLVFTYGVTNAGKTFTFVGPDHDSGLLPRSLSVLFNSIEGRVYGGVDLKPQRCRDFLRLNSAQQTAETSSKRALLRLCKESDRTLNCGRSTLLHGSTLSSTFSSDRSINSVSDADSFCLDVNPNVRFSVWVSFCEIYKENVYDLLEQVPSGYQKRTVLRLSQDIKGNCFIKDLRWVQVNSSDEAYKLMKIGKKNQSFSATRLNQLSSRSHSIFSIRILRVDHVAVPRVIGISELVLCDLAGSERCSRTQNSGERLKEAGNINSSLLTLGKCINAMRLNQNAKFQHHIPFRESKLTHFLQFFFCGAGRVSMVVNINQNSSCFDETLNVLKFSALAQKVVVLNSRPTDLDHAPHRSALELSMIIDEAGRQRNVSGRGRKSSLVAWETSLEDVMEDGEEDEEEDSVMDGTVLETEQKWSDREAALRLVLEAQIREEVSTEFMELFNKMNEDYRDRLEKDREILEERAEKRVEILKNLASRMADMSPEDSGKSLEQQRLKESELMEVCQQKDDIINKLQMALDSTVEDATRDRSLVESIRAKLLELQQNCRCLKTVGHDEEEETTRLKQEVEELKQERNRLKQEEEELVEERNRLKQEEEELVEERNRLKQVEEELVEERNRLKQEEEELVEERNRLKLVEERNRLKQEEEELVEERNRLKLVEERNRLKQEEEELVEERNRLKQVEEELVEERNRLKQVEEELVEERNRLKQVEEELVEERNRLKQVEEELTDLDQCPTCPTVFMSLESEQKETSTLSKENKALVNGIFQLQTQMTDLQKQLREQIDMSDSLSEQLNTTKTRLQSTESQSEERIRTISSLIQEVERLNQEVKEEERRSLRSSDTSHAPTQDLEKESQTPPGRMVQKCEAMEELQRQKEQLEERLSQRENACAQLTEELANQKAEFSCQLQSLRAELESEGRVLQRKVEEMRRQQQEERRELQQVISMKQKQVEEGRRQLEALTTELERVKVKPPSWDEEEEKENRAGSELRRPQERRKGRTEEERKRMFEVVKREVESLKEVESERRHRSPLKSNMAKKTPRATGSKRKICEVEGPVFSENKRNGNIETDRQACSAVKTGVSVHRSPSILSETVNTLVGQRVTKATRPKRGGKKLYHSDAAMPMLDSPDQALGGRLDDKESDHLIIRRQLRSNACRK